METLSSDALSVVLDELDILTVSSVCVEWKRLGDARLRRTYERDARAYLDAVNMRPTTRVPRRMLVRYAFSPPIDWLPRYACAACGASVWTVGGCTRCTAPRKAFPLVTLLLPTLTLVAACVAARVTCRP